MLGDHSSAILSLEEALECARHDDDVEFEADLLQRLGYLRSELGDLQGAVAALTTSRDLCLRVGNRKYLAYCLHNLGWVKWKLGDSEGAVAAEREAIAVASDAKLKHVAIVSSIYLAIFDIGNERYELAAQTIRAAYNDALEANLVEPQMHALMVLSLALLAIGDTREAAQTALKAIEAYDDLGGTQQFEVELFLVSALCLESAERVDEALVMQRRALDIARRTLEGLQDHEDLGERRLAAIGAGLPQLLDATRERLLRDVSASTEPP
jgi:tetratricopeptide (TPR) repeat protein